MSPPIHPPEATSQQCDPIRTAGQDEAIRAGASNLASGAFEALADAHFRRQRGQATKAEIAYLDATPEWQIEAALKLHRDVVIPDRQRIAADLRRHGRRAHAFYREVRPQDYDAVAATSTVPQLRHRPLARRRGAGRPSGARRRGRPGESSDPDGESSEDGDAARRTAERQQPQFPGLS